MLDVADRAHDRLGRGRGAGVRVDPRRRHADPVHRRGRRARHVQPSPRRAARRGRPATSTCRCRRCRRRRRRSRFTTARSPRMRRVGFEFGYNIQEPERLVLWEAQYGDFINGAQVDPRRVPHLGPREVGAWRRRSCCCCRTATKGRARITRARASSASSTPPPTRTCASPTARRRRSTSTCSGDRRSC